VARKPWPESPHQAAIERLTNQWEHEIEERDARLLRHVFPDPNEITDAFKEALADTIARLPEADKLVITLHYYEELTLGEIGEVLGVSKSEAARIHAAAIVRLRSRLEHRQDDTDED
jgi:RNA polymerase sigma factor (sigma-70 family)